MEFVFHDPSLDSYKNSREFRDYLAASSVVETSPQRYRVTGEYSRRQAADRLLGISEDMLMDFGVLPTPVDSNQTPLEFANQYGIFYIDVLKE